MNISDTLERHAQWLADAQQGERIDLCNAHLDDFDFGWCDLREADLRGAKLRNADMRETDCRGADMRDADLRQTDFTGADLRGADLRGAWIDLVGWPLWDGGQQVIVDKLTAIRFARMFCSLICDDAEVQAAQDDLRALLSIPMAGLAGPDGKDAP